MAIKYKSIRATISGAKTLGYVEDLINERVDEKRVLAIAFYEVANASNVPYSLRVADSANTLQDFTTRYDYLALLAGATFKPVSSFENSYKPYEAPGNGNKIKIGIRLDGALAGGQSITLDVVIKVEA